MVCGVSVLWCQDLFPDAGYTECDIDAIAAATRTFTAAAYKSLIQKIVRFCPERVQAGEARTYPADFVLAVAMGYDLPNPLTLGQHPCAIFAIALLARSPLQFRGWGGGGFAVGVK